jgi:hypothetical protein
MLGITGIMSSNILYLLNLTKNSLDVNELNMSILQIISATS